MLSIPTLSLFRPAGDWGRSPAVVENGIGATAISKWMVNKEVRFGILRTIAITDATQATPLPDVMRSFKLLKHRERFQTRIAQSFEQLLLDAKTSSALPIPGARHDIASS